MSFKIECMCPECESDQTKKNRSFAIGYLEEGKDVLNMTCNNAHNFQAIIGLPKFAFMFENGLTAYNAGFYFEAFSCFYSALELFRIDFIKTYFCEVESYDVQLVDQQIAHIKYSERIYGIYMMCYGLYFKDKADKKSKNDPTKIIISENDKSLRNAVIHAGKIITPKECADLGYKIYSYIRSIYQNFKSPDFDSCIPAPAIMFYYNKKAQALLTENPDALVINSDVLTSMALNTHFKNDLPTFKSLLAINSHHNKNKDDAEFIVNNQLFRQ